MLISWWALQAEQETVWSHQIDHLTAKISPRERHQKWSQPLSRCRFQHVRHSQMTVIVSFESQLSQWGTATSWNGTHLVPVCPKLCNVHSYCFIMKHEVWESQQWCSPYSSCMSNSQVFGNQWGKESSGFMPVVCLEVRLTVHLSRKKVIQAAHWIKS